MLKVYAERLLTFLGIIFIRRRRLVSLCYTMIFRKNGAPHCFFGIFLKHILTVPNLHLNDCYFMVIISDYRKTKTQWLMG